MGDPAMNKIVRHTVFLFCYGLFFSLLGGLAVYIYLNTRITVQPWHAEDLLEEYTAESCTVHDLESYKKLEERLFRELKEKVYQPNTASSSLFNRYARGSLSDSFGYAINWNRTFELAADNPRGGILMLHGLTDSPYSLRAIAQGLQSQGFWVLELRLPGHGTIPAALTRINWQDWLAATKLGARHVREKIGPELPFYIAGYSNGGALAVAYSLSVLSGEDVPLPAGLILISPELDLRPVASLAKFQLALSKIPGLGKLAWESVMMEYDPFKYNSFPVNAGNQAYRLTKHIQGQLETLRKSSKLQEFPPVLAFQSIVDATIKTEGVVDSFLRQLPPGVHAIVLYDVNQMALAQNLLAEAGKDFKSRLLADPDLPFGVTLVTNVNQESSELEAIHKMAMQESTERAGLGLSWPQGVYSLSHVALPFPPDDPIYGDIPPQNVKHIQLGRLLLRGEKRCLPFQKTIYQDRDLILFTPTWKSV